jgi:general L-amino acid transport system permease protein
MSDTHSEQARATAFVRTEMLPQSPPPASSVGLVGWLRANLFSSWLNTLVTLICLAVIWYVLAGLIPWTFQSVWSAKSLNECREIMQATWGDTHGHACWGVIRDRWEQLLFGFYPNGSDGTPDLRWRPILALILLVVAVAPILFAEQTPRALLIVTAAFPFVMPWLLWGGTVWLPVMVAAGLVVGYLVARFAADALGSLAALILGVVATLLCWFILVGPLSSAFASMLPLELTPVPSRLFGGFMLSILIGVVAIGCSLPLGILLALGRQSDLLIVKAICVGFIEFIRGVPLITLLFVASTLLNIFMPPGTNFDIILRVIIMVTLFASAYMAEVIRGGLAALPKGQYEGADSLGLDYWQAQRLIIMPQALKISIPGIVSTFIGVFKDTTLVSIIGLLDPIGLSNSIRADSAWNGVYWELFAFIALLFFIFCFGMSRYSMYLEKRLRTDHR